MTIFFLSVNIIFTILLHLRVIRCDPVGENFGDCLNDSEIVYFIWVCLEFVFILYIQCSISVKK